MHQKVCSSLFAVVAVNNGPVQHLSRMETHQSRLIRSEGSALVIYCKVPGLTQQVFYEVRQLSKQINHTAVVSQNKHAAQSNHISDRMIATVSIRKWRSLGIKDRQPQRTHWLQAITNFLPHTCDAMHLLDFYTLTKDLCIE